MTPIFKELGSEPNEKVMKKILKVALSTSLNGGNPLSDERFLDNFSLNAKESIQNERKTFPESSFKEFPVYKATVQALKNFQLVQEVSKLSKYCVIQEGKKEETRYLSYTVDRFEPYIVDKPHKIREFYKVLKSFFCL